MLRLRAVGWITVMAMLAVAVIGPTASRATDLNPVRPPKESPSPQATPAVETLTPTRTLLPVRTQLPTRTQPPVEETVPPEENQPAEETPPPQLNPIVETDACPAGTDGFRITEANHLVEGTYVSGDWSVTIFDVGPTDTDDGESESFSFKDADPPVQHVLVNSEADPNTYDYDPEGVTNDDDLEATDSVVMSSIDFCFVIPVVETPAPTPTPQPNPVEDTDACPGGTDGFRITEANHLVAGTYVSGEWSVTIFDVGPTDTDDGESRFFSFRDADPAVQYVLVNSAAITNIYDYTPDGTTNDDNLRATDIVPMGSIDFCFAIPVVTVGTIFVVKVDNKGTEDFEDDELLDGASFSLYLDNQDGVFDDSEDLLISGPDEAVGGSINWTDLVDGSYWVVEVVVPDGYVGTVPLLIPVDGDAPSCIYDRSGVIDCDPEPVPGDPTFSGVFFDNTPEEQPTPTPTRSATPSPTGSPSASTSTPPVRTPPVRTLPPTDALIVPAEAGGDSWRLVLIAIAGLLSGILLLTPNRRRR